MIVTTLPFGISKTLPFAISNGPEIIALFPSSIL